MRGYLAVTLGLAAALTFSPAPVSAVDDPAPPVNADHVAGQRAITAKDWSAALKSLSAAERTEPRSADIQNLLGYAYRSSGQLDLAFKHYERALQLNPRHLGAHEYIGEAYLMTNKPEKAEEHLAALKRHCSRQCAQRDDLEKAIAEFKRRTAAAK